MALSKKDLKEIMKKLAKNRSVFHSEADFQHSLALEIKNFRPELELRLEKFSGIEKNEKKKDKSIYIDIVLIDKDKKIISAIELKYKTYTQKKWEKAKPIDKEDYFLKNQAAEDLGRYDFLKDIKRLESFNKDYNCQKSFAIMLTNDKHYWDSKYGKGGFSEEFLISDRREISKNKKLNWIELKSEGNKISKGTKNEREDSIELSNSYVLEWDNYKKVEELPQSERLFKYLIVEI